MKTLFSGVVGGAMIGLLIGVYVLDLTVDYVVQHDDFAHPVAFEEAQARYSRTIVTAFVLAFSVVGPYVAAASFGPWIRHAVLGLVGSIVTVVIVALIAALLTNEQPFNRSKGSESTSIDIARMYGIPAAIVMGPVIAMLVGRLTRREAAIKATK
ncbi:MAG TPA: hypothetical protein VMP01_28455 [Pirellulaceae bacterium]|nr:hypothetical protein [Pirellulaceae bacterium]